MKLALLLLTVLVGHKAYATCPKTGLSIIQEQEKKQRVKYEFQDQEIVLLDIKSKNKEQRSMKHYSVQTEDGKDKNLLTFMSPPEIKGTALLNWRESSSDNQWIYLPALKKLQRVASGSKRKYFMGTDFTFADLEGDVIENYNYTCEKVVKCEGGECYQITATPKTEETKRVTGYTKRVFLINKENLTTLKISYYNLKGKLFKKAEYSKWVKVGKVFRPNFAVMTRGRKHKTYIKIKNRNLNDKIDDIIFSKRYVEKEMHTK